LSGFDQLLICTNYRKGEKSFSELPFGPGELKGYEPIYEQLPGWQEDIQSIRKWDDLPHAARDYILRIEELIGIQVRLISVGPERDQVIEKT
jgi:adenylosuccinate synthase